MREECDGGAGAVIAASSLPAIRDEMGVYLEINGGEFLGEIIGLHLARGGTCDLPSPETGLPWDHAMRAYQRRLVSMVETAELFHVSAEMTEVAAQAGLQMPGYRLHRKDLPAESGLIVFDVPIGVATHDDVAAAPRNLADVRNLADATARGDRLSTVASVAALWRFAATAEGRPGVLVTLWSDNYDLAAQQQARRPELAALLRGMGRLGYHDETVLPFQDRGEDPRGLSDGQEPVRHEALRTLIATWLLMGQPIVSTDPEPLPRQVRRARERAGREVPRVRVVRLRHHTRRGDPATDDAAATRTYRRRWVVEGHWRNQWYPSRQSHRPVYVPSYIKGPDGAPLIGGQKVYDWRR